MHESKILITFNSTHHAMMAEEILKNQEIPFKTRMTPRQITSECGLALVVSSENMAVARRSLLQTEKIPVIYLYRYLDGTWTLLKPEKK